MFLLFKRVHRPPNSSCIQPSAIMVLTVRHTLLANGTYMDRWLLGNKECRNVISVLIIPNNYLFLHETPSCITRYNTTISCTKADKLDPGWISSSLFIIIITLVRHNTARFDTKMPGSTPKGTVRHKNAQFDTKMPYPACIIWHCHYQTSSPFLLQLFSNFLF